MFTLSSDKDYRNKHGFRVRFRSVQMNIKTLHVKDTHRDGGLYGTHPVMSFLPPPREGVKVEAEKRSEAGALRAGGLLIATDMLCSPTASPSIFITACAALC